MAACSWPATSNLRPHSPRHFLSSSSFLNFFQVTRSLPNFLVEDSRAAVWSNQRWSQRKDKACSLQIRSWTVPEVFQLLMFKPLNVSTSWRTADWTPWYTRKVNWPNQMRCQQSIISVQFRRCVLHTVIVLPLLYAFLLMHNQARESLQDSNSSVQSICEFAGVYLRVKGVLVLSFGYLDHIENSNWSAGRRSVS
jgi:hypothetical protein